MEELKSQNVNNFSKEDRSIIYVFAIIFLSFVVIQMFFTIRNKTDKHHRIMELALRNCGLKAGPNDYYHIDNYRKTFTYCFVDSGYDIQGIAESFSEYMDYYCGVFYEEGYRVEIRFVHKINHNHEETVFSLTNYDYANSKVLKTFETGEISKYADESFFEKYCGEKINCVKNLYMSAPIQKNFLSIFENIETITIYGDVSLVNQEEAVKHAEEEVRELFPKAEIATVLYN
ncbi:MAG: hypothetical protein IKW90_16210 [Lachnospiraceae bacterium]|nr:hypothetical protein [Lachnospiraceae bacterium]